MPNLNKLFEYVGAIHIHTKDSDGSRTHSEIIKIADRFHLDFLLFTDHMTLEHKNIEGWHNRILVLVGYEIHDPNDRNHYLAFGLDRTLPEGLSAPEFVREVKKLGGLGIIAHPDEVREMKSIPAYPWTAWNVDDFDGIEVWNHMSSWLEGVNKGMKIKYLLHPRSILRAPAEETLRKWDEIAERRRILGVGSLDAHASEYWWGPFRMTVFPYKVQLQSIRTHILMESPLLPEDFAGSRRNFMRSLSESRVFISHYRWGNARGFRFWCESPNQYAIIGGAMREHPKIVFKVQCPDPGTIKLIHRGKVIATCEGDYAEFPSNGAGAYRIEVFKGDKGWIFSNHIRILHSRDELDKRQRRFHPDDRRGKYPQRNRFQKEKSPSAMKEEKSQDREKAENNDNQQKNERKNFDKHRRHTKHGRKPDNEQRGNRTRDNIAQKPAERNEQAREENKPRKKPYRRYYQRNRGRKPEK